MGAVCVPVWDCDVPLPRELVCELPECVPEWPPECPLPPRAKTTGELKAKAIAARKTPMTTGRADANINPPQKTAYAPCSTLDRKGAVSASGLNLTGSTRILTRFPVVMD